ncbi:MAG: 50S ribosomal protein L20, partial [Clostridia bacterium]|nr:50S ribosomal protein L20 [Clostridia bacterium]
MRIKRAVTAIKKRRKIMKQAKGFYGGMHRLYRIAKQQVIRSGYYAYVGR